MNSARDNSTNSSPATTGLMRRFVDMVAIVIAAQAVYSAIAGTFDISLGRTILLAAAIAVLLLGHPLQPTGNGSGSPMIVSLRILDVLLVAVFCFATWHLIGVLEFLEESIYSFTDFDVAIACVGVLIILEATRRAFGWPIVLVTAAGLIYLVAGPWLPGFLHHAGVDLNRAMQMIWYGFQGIYGTPLGVVIQVVLIFIVFGLVLEKTGASDSLIRISLALSGGTRGGPGHAAVIASAMFGSMSGSVTANVVGTGSFTIPMIKRRGFAPQVAGAIEAGASTGGQIVPPVMGAAAFLMADLLNVGYGTIVISALVPALLYYAALFVAISVEAAKSGIRPLAAQDRVALTRHDAVASLSFVLPVIAIAAVLISGYSATMAGFIATLLAAVLGLFRKSVRQNPLRVYGAALIEAGRACAAILVVVGCIGVVIGVMNLTGLGISFASMVAGFIGHSLLLALLITALASLMLGMGMPTLPAYMIIVLVLGPALGKMGVQPLVAHMFVFYFGVLSAITPPVAIGAFAAAPIAGASPMRTAITSVRLAFIGFIIPFVFVFEPQLLLVGEFDALTFLRVVLALMLAIWFLSTALAGHANRPLGHGERIVHALLGIGLLIQWPVLQWVLMLACIAKWQIDRRRRDPVSITA